MEIQLLGVVVWETKARTLMYFRIDADCWYVGKNLRSVMLFESTDKENLKDGLPVKMFERHEGK